MKILGSAFAVMLFFCLAEARAAAPLSACGKFEEITDNSPPETYCQSYIIGVSHGLDFAMSHFGYRPIFCLPPGLDLPSDIYNTTLPRLRDLAREQPTQALFMGASIALMDTFPCDGSQPGENSSAALAGSMIAYCKVALENNTEMHGCAGYFHGSWHGLKVSPGRRGAPEWFCPPKSDLSSKDIFEILVDEAIEDPSVQQETAVSVIAQGLAERYPCHSDS